MVKKSVFFFLVFTVLLGLRIEAQNNEEAFSYTKNLEIYANIIKALNASYIDSLNFEELNKTAIDALLLSLDPYTVYIPEAAKESLEFVRTGEYGGVGLMIVKNKHDYAYISNLMPSQSAEKAGLQIGDKIVRIDGRDTREMDYDHMATIIKGVPGQPFRLSVERIGESGTVDYLLTRQKIKVKNIAFSCMLDHSIAYVAMQSFTLNAADELLYAYLELRENNPKGLIIDLRGNAGGLILEAVHALNVFLQREIVVVRTESTKGNSDYVYRTQRPPVDLYMPLVFLVDDQTASAAEIMAGAAQDYDRAVLIGQNTYGKGLVQNVHPLNYDAQLKMSIARYILPSGRKIQKEKPKNSERFFNTLNGRPVYEGDGLSPDILIAKKISSPLLKDQLDRLFIFEFAAEYYAGKNRPILDVSFIVDSAILEAYEQFLFEKKYAYISPVEKQISDLYQQSQSETGHEELLPILKQAEEKQRQFSNQQSPSYTQELKNLLRFEILTQQYYREGAARLCLNDDPAIQKAIETLSEPSTYQALVKPKK